MVAKFISPQYGSDPINKITAQTLTLRWNRPIREAKIGQMTDLIVNSSVKSNSSMEFYS